MSIEKVLQPMLIMSKIFGFAPFSISEGSSTKKVFTIIHSSAIVAIIILINCIFHQKYSSTFIFRYTLWGRVYGNMVIITLCYIFIYTFKNKIKDAILLISAFDKKLCVLTDQYEKTCKKELKVITAGIITLGIIIVIELGFFSSSRVRQDVDPDAWSEIALLILYNCSKLAVVVMVQAQSFFYCIWDRYRLLNGLLKDIFVNFKTRKNSNQRKEIMIIDDNNILKREDEIFALLDQLLVIKDLHNQLTKIAKTINYCYSIQILLYIIKAIIKMTTLTFFFVHCIIIGICGNGLKINLDYIFLIVFMLLANFLAVYPLMYVASRTAYEANKTRKLLFELMPCITEDSLAKYPGMEIFKFEVQIFSLKLYHQDLKFKVCNLFILNEKLLFEIIGAISAYIIVILQFYLLFQSDNKIIVSTTQPSLDFNTSTLQQ